MKLYFKVGTMPARYYGVYRKRKPPVVGDVFKPVDKTVHRSKPFQVRLTEIKLNLFYVAIYFVEQW